MSHRSMSRRWRIVALTCLAASVARAQEKPTVVAISGELTATPLSRAVAQRVGMLLQQTHVGFAVVPADTIAWLLDNVISYTPGNPSLPQDLREICRQFNATAIIDIMMFQSRNWYRGVAFRPVQLRRPSRPLASETALVMIGQAFASTADSVAFELVPQVVEALRRAQTGTTPATRYVVSCPDFADTADSLAHRPRAPSNTRCC